MDYLAREGAPISSEMWEKIDAAVIDNAKKHMVCRRFLSLYGPLGAGASTVVVDSLPRRRSLRTAWDVLQAAAYWSCLSFIRISHFCGGILRTVRSRDIRWICLSPQRLRSAAPSRRMILSFSAAVNWEQKDF